MKVEIYKDRVKLRLDIRVYKIFFINGTRIVCYFKLKNIMG